MTDDKKMKKTSVRLLDSTNLKNIINYDISRLYLEADDVVRSRPDIGSLNSHGTEVCIVLPDIFTSKAEALIDENFDLLAGSADGFMVQSLDEIFYLKEKGYPLDKTIASERLYVCNNESVAFLKELGMSSFTHPLEMTLRQGLDVSFGRVETVVYGRAPLMVSAGCVRKNTVGCDKTQQKLILKDRKKMDFYVQNRCDYCYNVIYNSVPTMMIDEQESLHPDCESVRFDITTESGDEISSIFRLHAACCDGTAPPAEKLSFPYTRGHYHKGFNV